MCWHFDNFVDWLHVCISPNEEGRRLKNEDSIVHLFFHHFTFGDWFFLSMVIFLHRYEFAGMYLTMFFVNTYEQNKIS